MQTATTNPYQTALKNHYKLAARRTQSLSRIEEIRNQFTNDTLIRSFDGIAIYVAGSIGRLESGSASDLDLFIISPKNNVSQLDTYKLMAKIIEINNDLGFPEFSNDGKYLKIHSIDKMVSATSSPNDDSENMFTTRMLLLLESKFIYNETQYNNHIKTIVENYFRDAGGRTKDFKPMFILNDILRYWRTLCLNYEGIRNDPNRPWRKKNINLKFSRMLTVFGTVAPLLVERTDKKKFLSLCKKTPLERLASALPHLGSGITPSRFNELLDDYEMFLELKENKEIEHKIKRGTDLKRDINDAAERLSVFLYDCLTSETIESKYKRLLVV